MGGGLLIHNHRYSWFGGKIYIYVCVKEASTDYLFKTFNLFTLLCCDLVVNEPGWHS